MFQLQKIQLQEVPLESGTPGDLGRHALQHADMDRGQEPELVKQELRPAEGIIRRPDFV